MLWLTWPWPNRIVLFAWMLKYAVPGGVPNHQCARGEVKKKNQRSRGKEAVVHWGKNKQIKSRRRSLPCSLRSVSTCIALVYCGRNVSRDAVWDWDVVSKPTRRRGQAVVSFFGLTFASSFAWASVGWILLLLLTGYEDANCSAHSTFMIRRLPVRARSLLYDNDETASCVRPLGPNFPNNIKRYP